MHAHEILLRALSAGEPVAIVMKFNPDAANAPTYDSGDLHRQWSVVRTSQGLFTITFKKAYVRLLSVLVGLQIPAAGSARWIQVGAYSKANKTLQIRIVDAAGAVQDLGAANADNSVSVTVIFSKTKVA